MSAAIVNHPFVLISLFGNRLLDLVISAGVVDTITFFRTSNLASTCSKSCHHNIFFSQVVLVRSAKIFVIIKIVQVKNFALFCWNCCNHLVFKNSDFDNTRRCMQESCSLLIFLR